MLQLYDLNKVKISNLTLYKDLKIQSVLSTGDKTLSFSYPSRSSDEIKEEGYIRTKTHEFVIKEISTNGDWKSIQAVLNVEDLEGKTWEHFDTSDQTITECLTLALAGTGWMIGYCNETKKRTISKTNCSTWDIIQEIKKTYFVEMEFDTLNKRINIAQKLGNDKGVYFIDSLNLKDLDVKSNSYDFCTRIIAIGKDDLKVTVENYQYSSKKKTIIWKDEKYTDESSLREDANAKLEELSKPYRSYGADIVDLASINDKYSILSYGLGDIITLISKEEGIKEKQRIVKMVEYPDEPDKNTCEIANTVLTFEDMQKEYEDTSKTVNNITSSNGTISEGAIKGTVEKITIKKADIESLNAVEMRVGDLAATSATITQLDAANVNIANLQANKADITDLDAGVGRIEILESSVGDIETLVNGNLTSNNIHSLALTSDKVTVDNGFIKNAMIDNLDVSKIKAGDISTNKFKIKSDNGGIEIVGATQQFKDKNNKVRIQMGQDTKGDFNFILRGEDGTTTLMDHTGIKENAIADDLIKGNMISENAVGGKQIDYNSFTKEFNKDTNTNTLKSSKVLLDENNQTLDVGFNILSNTVDGVKSTTESNSTTINVQQGEIDKLISNTTIVKDGNTLQLKDAYNSTVETVNSISSTIGKHTSTIDTLTGEIKSVDDKTNEVKRTLGEISSKVSSVEQTTQRKVVAFRYIRDWLNGSTANTSNNWVELKVMAGDTNIAKGLVPTGSVALSNPAYLTDDDINANKSVSCASNWQYVQLDLGSIRSDIDMLKIWHHYPDGRIYKHKLQVSSDGVTWIDLFNSEVSGGYKETANGRTHIINDTSIDARIKTAEQKLTVDSLTTTISSNFYTKNQADGKYVVESSIGSIIQQNPDSVKIGFNKITDLVTISPSGLNVKNGSIQAATNFNGFTKRALLKDGELQLGFYNSGGNLTHLGEIAARENSMSIYSPKAIEFANSSPGSGNRVAAVMQMKPGSTNNDDLATFGVNGSLSISLASNIGNVIIGSGNEVYTRAGGPLYVNNNNGSSSQWGGLYVRNGHYAWGNLTCNDVNCEATVTAIHLNVTGSKNCIVDTSIGKVAVNAYETDEYWFGSIGSGTIENGECMIWIDDLFKQTVNTKVKYHVFLTKYGQGDIWVSERNENYFVVKCTTDIEFSFEIKVKRKGYETHVLERVNKNLQNPVMAVQDGSTYYVDKTIKDTEKEIKEQINVINSNMFSIENLQKEIIGGM